MGSGNNSGMNKGFGMGRGMKPMNGGFGNTMSNGFGNMGQSNQNWFNGSADTGGNNWSSQFWNPNTSYSSGFAGMGNNGGMPSAYGYDGTGGNQGFDFGNFDFGGLLNNFMSNYGQQYGTPSNAYNYGMSQVGQGNVGGYAMDPTTQTGNSGNTYNPYTPQLPADPTTKPVAPDLGVTKLPNTDGGTTQPQIGNRIMRWANRPDLANLNKNQLERIAVQFQNQNRTLGDGSSGMISANGFLEPNRNGVMRPNEDYYRQMAQSAIDLNRTVGGSIADTPVGKPGMNTGGNNRNGRNR